MTTFLLRKIMITEACSSSICLRKHSQFSLPEVQRVSSVVRLFNPTCKGLTATLPSLNYFQEFQLYPIFTEEMFPWTLSMHCRSVNCVTCELNFINSAEDIYQMLKLKLNSRECLSLCWKQYWITGLTEQCYLLSRLPYYELSDYFT
jgi:hypothetical protein